MIVVPVSFLAKNISVCLEDVENAGPSRAGQRLEVRPVLDVDHLAERRRIAVCRAAVCLISSHCRVRSLLAVLTALLLSGNPSLHAQDPATDGSWTQPFKLPLISIHAALLPTGKVLLFSAEHGVPGIHAWELDPRTLGLRNVGVPAGWNLDCAGHSFLSDGRLLIAGGTLGFRPVRGTKRAYLYNPWRSGWKQIANMREGRWYPSNVTLADGSVLTFAGVSTNGSIQNEDIESWDPNSVDRWRLIGRRKLPYYPLLHLLTDGKIFMAGPEPMAERYDPKTNKWTAVAKFAAAGRYEAASVLLPPSLDEIMVIGGFRKPGQPTSTVEIIDTGKANPTWRPARPMNFARYEHDAVVLPDGRVLVIGGRSRNSNNDPRPVLVPEIYDPANNSWTKVAAHKLPRMYHSTAILLPDGRVLVAGADRQPSGEIYSPPYLSLGPRPTIVDAPAAVSHGKTFQIKLTSATQANSVVLLRLNSVTHSINMGQRYVRLAQLSGGSGTFTVQAPKDGNVAPPGYYTLFVVDAGGVPSVSRMLRVVDKLAEFQNLGKGLSGSKGVPVLTASGTLAGGGTVTYELSNAAPKTSAIFVLGLSRIDVAIFGGTLVPSPDLILPGLLVDASGRTRVTVPFPRGLPTGFSTWQQFWVLDGGAAQGLAASNGLRSRTP